MSRMDFLKWSITATICSKSIIVLVFGYLFLLYRDRYMGIWVLSGLLYVLRFIFFDFSEMMHISVYSSFLYQILYMGAEIFLVMGMYIFMEQPVPKRWLYMALAVTFISDLAIIISNTALSKIHLPTCWFVSILLIWTGVIFLRRLRVHSIGKYLTGGALILLGVHNFICPLLVYPSSVPWRFLLEALLQITVALGTLQIYSDKIRLNLNSKERYYRLITENALDIIYRFQYTPEPAFEYVSPAVMDITGYSPADYYADPQLELKITHPEDRRVMADFRNAPDLTIKPAIFRMIRKDGALIWTEQRGVPIYDNTGTLIAFEGIIRDITDRKRLEQDMARLEGLNAIGQMAANIAHEIRNPMTTVRGYLQLLGNKKEFSAYKDEFALLLSELDRTNAIITEYLALSKGKMVNLNVGKLNEVIQAMLPLIQADANANGKSVETELTEILDIYLDEKEIRQLILNLVRNGLEAMDDGGILTIGTRREQDSVVLAIRDQGKGIPEEILGKIGTPFFTTKENGTGLGLAVCYRIASRHQAVIRLETNTAGTTFHVHFPLANGGVK